MHLLSHHTLGRFRITANTADSAPEDTQLEIARRSDHLKVAIARKSHPLVTAFGGLFEVVRHNRPDSGI